MADARKARCLAIVGEFLAGYRNQPTTNKDDDMNIEINKAIENIEHILQEARGELSRYEYEFPTGSPEQELIVEFLERLDEASDPKVIAENIRDDAESYGVGCEKILTQELQEGDIILSFGEPFEVTRLDGRWNLYAKEITGCRLEGEEETVVMEHDQLVTIALRN